MSYFKNGRYSTILDGGLLDGRLLDVNLKLGGGEIVAKQTHPSEDRASYN